MNALTLNNQPQTMTSRDIAELVESRHDHVKRSIDRLVAQGVIAPPPSGEVECLTSGPKYIWVYHVGKRDTYVIVAQLSPQFTARLVDRWQELEARATPVISTTLAGALRLAAEQAEQIEAAQAQIAVMKPLATVGSMVAQHRHFLRREHLRLVWGYDSGWPSWFILVMSFQRYYRTPPPWTSLWSPSLPWSSPQCLGHGRL